VTVLLLNIWNYREEWTAKRIERIGMDDRALSDHCGLLATLTYTPEADPSP